MLGVDQQLNQSNRIGAVISSFQFQNAENAFASFFLWNNPVCGGGGGGGGEGGGGGRGGGAGRRRSRKVMRMEIGVDSVERVV